MKAYRIILPKEQLCSERDLYYRAEPESGVDLCYSAEGIILKKGTTISFDTYFNSFSYKKYAEHSRANSVEIKVDIKGSFIIKIFALCLSGSDLESNLLQCHEVKCNKRREYTFNQDFLSGNIEGFFYFELYSKSDGAVFYGGGYYLNDNVVLNNEVRVAIVICTYKREKYVYRNMANIVNYIIDNPNSSVQENMDIFIIDNGKTIDKSLLDNNKIYVLSNKNYGGSGGFTRGIIEAVKRRNIYTHVLLMDDDICFEIEVLDRTINFLKILKNRKICIGAGMLVEDKPWLQYESGAVWNGLYLKNLKHNLDMRINENLIYNNIYERVDYNAWWYFCLPLDIIDDNNLPLPFFIKSDDIEYGIRLKPQILLMNGIGIWHENFDTKYSSHLEYYCKRNETILTAIHYPQFSAMASIKKLLLALGKQLLLHRYEVVDLLFKAYEDFLKGIDYIKSVDAEELNIQLIKASIKNLDDKELERLGVEFNDNDYNNSMNIQIGWLDRLFQIITINGYLIPKTFYPSKHKASYIVVDMVNCNFDSFFLADRVLHYNPITKKGFVTTINKVKLISSCVRFLVLSTRLLLEYNKVARSYRERMGEITSLDFWCNHLGIDKVN